MVIYIPHGNKITTFIDAKGGMVMFGDFIKEKRINKEITLREFCRQLELDASNWSKIERGVMSPPPG